MNIMNISNTGISARLFAGITMLSLLLSALPVAFFVANAAATSITGESHTIDAANTPYSNTVDTTGLQNIVLTFDFDGSTLEGPSGTGFNAPVTVNYSAGAASGSVIVSDSNPIGPVTLSGLVADASLAITIVADDTSDFAGDDESS